MSTTLNLRQSSTLSSNTVQNLKNNSHCLAITTQSGKSNIDPSLPTVDEPRNANVVVNKKPKAELVNTIGIDVDAVKEKGKEKVDGPIVKSIPKPRPPFPQKMQ